VSKYASYYNEARTRLSLYKDAPISRPIERFGRFTASLWSVACIIATLEHSSR
jgi:hypothetical protein